MPGMLCISLGGTLPKIESIIDSLDPAREMIELRVDLLDSSSLAHLETIFVRAKSRGVSTIGTVRDVGEVKGFTPMRLKLVERCLESGACDFMDVEVEAPEEYRLKVVEGCRKHGVKVVVSYHEYVQEEKSSKGLRGKVEECFAKGADVAKVAVAVCSSRGAARVLSLYDDERTVVALGMGEAGKVTRVAAIALGAPFTFVAWDEESCTAPGQLSRAAMRMALGWDNEEQDLKKKMRIGHI